MIPICVLPDDHSNFNAITPGQFREMDIHAWMCSGLTEEEAEEYCDLADVGYDGINSDRFDKLSHKMAAFNTEERRVKEEKRIAFRKKWKWLLFWRWFKN